MIYVLPPFTSDTYPVKNKGGIKSCLRLQSPPVWIFIKISTSVSCKSLNLQGGNCGRQSHKTVSINHNCINLSMPVHPGCFLLTQNFPASVVIYEVRVKGIKARLFFLPLLLWSYYAIKKCSCPCDITYCPWESIYFPSIWRAPFDFAVFVFQLLIHFPVFLTVLFLVR